MRWFARVDKQREEVEQDAGPANRRMRRAMGFRGPAFKHPGLNPITRYVIRHYVPAEFSQPRTRRQRKVRARILRAIARRGLDVQA